ncbi:hypothetical protein ABPG77_004989 [Micractinium sp. CCAP 211/92]
MLAGLAVLLLLGPLAQEASARAASFVVETGSMRITAPPQIAGAHDSAIGDFGVPLYGGTLTGSVLLIPENHLGCSEFAAPLPANGTLPPVLLVDRGDCFFVEKARFGQRAGAKAVMVADHTEEPLLTMAIPEDRPEVAALVQEISIPVVLVAKSVGDSIKSALQASGAAQPEVVVELDWRESIAHPDARVEWELWLTSQDACGRACNSTRTFLQTFTETAKSLEQEQFTQFTPHVMTRSCSRWQTPAECQAGCIHRGRYCAVTAVPAEHSGRYTGAQVMEQNKRHLCAYQTANLTQHEPWRWWDYASGFAVACTMAAGRFDVACAEGQLRAAGIDVAAVDACMGPSDADGEHPIMQAQVAAQADAERSGRGLVILLPTVVINNDQYRGLLAAPAVLRALCSGFAEGSEPPICLSGALNVDDCASGTNACWRGPGGESACVDTFRGFVCRCPAGWEGNGHTCADIDECELHIDGCDQICVNTQGSYHCACNRGYTLHGGQGAPGMCLPDSLASSRLPAWLIALLIVGTVVGVSVVGLFAYRWRLHREMRREVHAIMREYLPIGASEAETAELRQSLLHDASSKEGGPRGGGGGGGNGGRRSSGRFAGRGKHRRMADPEAGPREEGEAGIDGVGGSSESTTAALLSPHTCSHPPSQAPAREDRR